MRSAQDKEPIPWKRKHPLVSAESSDEYKNVAMALFFPSRKNQSELSQSLTLRGIVLWFQKSYSLKQAYKKRWSLHD